eukprot:1838595-Prymnesium_polylepis.1
MATQTPQLRCEENLLKETLLADGKTTLAQYMGQQRAAQAPVEDDKVLRGLGPPPRAPQQLVSPPPSASGQSALLAAVVRVAPNCAELHRQVESGSVVPIFGYGSNNVEQLRGRLEEPALQEFPA